MIIKCSSLLKFLYNGCVLSASFCCKILKDRFFFLNIIYHQMSFHTTPRAHLDKSWERENLKQTVHCEHRAQGGVQSHETQYDDLSRNQESYAQLSEPPVAPQVSFSSHYIKGIYYQNGITDHVNLNHWVKVFFVRFTTFKLLFPPAPTHFPTVHFRRKSLHTTYM